MATYNTEQRNELIRFLTQNKEKAFSIDDICEGMAKDGSFITPPGKSTVYRLIPKLVEDKLVREFAPLKSRRKVYQLVGGESCVKHMHLKCTCCGKIIHMSDEQTKNLAEIISLSNSFFVNSGETTLFGTCQGCSNRG